MYGITIEDIRTIAHNKAHSKRRRVGRFFSSTYATVHDADYREWARLAVLADIALSLRTLAAPPAPPKKQGS